MNRGAGRHWTGVQSPPRRLVVVSRRDFLRRAGRVAGGAGLVAGGVALGAVAAGWPGIGAGRGSAGGSSCPPLPWPCPALDAAAVASRAYAAYYQGACAYGVASGLLGELSAREGGPYTGIPAGMFGYGERGAAGWQTLCGALNAAAAVITLTVDRAAALAAVSELFRWYSATALPGYVPDPGPRLLVTRATPADLDLPSSVAGSPLCRDSVGSWCRASGHRPGSPERAERCARLTADVADQAALVLNRMHGHEPA